MRCPIGCASCPLDRELIHLIQCSFYLFDQWSVPRPVNRRILQLQNDRCVVCFQNNPRTSEFLHQFHGPFTCTELRIFRVQQGGGKITCSRKETPIVIANDHTSTTFIQRFNHRSVSINFCPPQSRRK